MVDLQRVQWLGVSLEVPAEWEIVRHAVDRTRGTLSFVDRRHQRLSLSWVPCEREPDIARMMSDSRSRDELTEKAHGFTAIPSTDGWRGYRWREGERSLTRAGRYDHCGGRWLEAVVVWPSSRDPELERRMLASCALAETPVGFRHTRAFGMSVSCPEGWELSRVTAEPGRVAFSYRAGRTTAMVSRAKALEGWWGDNLQVVSLRRGEGIGAPRPGVPV